MINQNIAKETVDCCINFLTSNSFDWKNLNDKKENYNFSELSQHNKIEKYETTVQENNLYFTVEHCEDKKKFNLEISYPDEFDMVYQIPYLDELQSNLQGLYNKIQCCNSEKAKYKKLNRTLSDLW